MTLCTACGHQLGVGRFCTNCGAPVDSSTSDGTPVSTPAADWRTDTAERKLGAPAVSADPRTPPAAVAPPPPPRYPLFADEVDSWAPADSLVTPETAPAFAPPAPAEEYVDQAPYLGSGDDKDYDDYEHYDDYEDDGRRTALPWILAALAVLAIVVAGWWFLARDDGTDPGAGSDDSSAETSPNGDAEGVEVSGRASAKAPETAQPNQDVNGDQVAYDASNMLDGVVETAWRAPADAGGMELVFKHREPTELTQVGLVNGYAKTSTDDKGRTFDWYLGNRRIETVLWVFGEGHKQRQKLTETRDLQTVDVDPVTTSRVVLRIIAVSPPGDGTASRDFTAVSEVSLVGVPAAG